MSFEEFPDELTLQICQEMDIPTLSKFVQTSKGNYRICNEILNERITK